MFYFEFQMFGFPIPMSTERQARAYQLSKLLRCLILIDGVFLILISARLFYMFAAVSIIMPRSVSSCVLQFVLLCAGWYGAKRYSAIPSMGYLLYVGGVIALRVLSFFFMPVKLPFWAAVISGVSLLILFWIAWLTGEFILLCIKMSPQEKAELLAAEGVMIVPPAFFPSGQWGSGYPASFVPQAPVQQPQQNVYVAQPVGQPFEQPVAGPAAPHHPERAEGAADVALQQQHHEYPIAQPPMASHSMAQQPPDQAHQMQGQGRRLGDEV